jgi:hypothetical protein
MLVNAIPYKYNIVLELAKFENPFPPLILHQAAVVFTGRNAIPWLFYTQHRSQARNTD